MVLNDVKISQKMKNKGYLSIEKDIRQQAKKKKKLHYN